jgi:glycosyltransferase involved in cell wall biosynthesis
VSSSDGAPVRVLYLLTDEISSVLVRGQLGFLVEQGFDVTVATRRADPAVPPEPGKWDDGVAVEQLPFVREPSPVADVRALFATVGLIRRVRPDIVNASTPKAGLLGSVAGWPCRVPMRVYVVRGLRFETATGWRRRMFRRLEWLAVRCATHVLFNSHSLMAVAEREGVIRPGRGEVLGAGSGNGIDVTRFADDALPSRADARAQLGLPVDAEVIGFVGRFTNDKGIADLVHAFLDRFGERPDVWLLLVGQFEEGDPVPADVRRSIETHDRIVTAAWLDHTGVAYRAMDVLAFPSYREGLPNVPLEAQLCGVPVVGYAATGTVDAVAPDGEAGVLVPVGDRDGLGAALESLIDDRGGRERMGAAGRAWVAGAFDRVVLWKELADRFNGWSRL